MMFPIGFGVLGAVRQFLGFDPKSLFANSEPGVWYDPSDMSTMFQDAAGTTPVTAMEQPVGLILDKSKGLVLGPEQVTNGSFSADTNWTKGAGWSIAGGVATFNGSTFSSLVQTLSVVSGRSYQVEIIYSQISAGGSVVVAGGIGGITATTAGVYKFIFTASSSTATLEIGANLVGGVRFAGSVDNISVRELPGNHATQTTATSRPVLSARVNLLTATETLATQTVTTRATTQTLRFEGAGTVTLSGTATGTYSAGSHSVTTTAGNLTLTVSGTVTKADLRATNMGIGLPAYQRVNTATDYDTAGFPMYLRFDGVDDWLVTPSIDFTGTDKMTVFAGVRKLSDAARGSVVELTTSTAANNGAFQLTAPESASATFAFISKGTTQSTAIASSLPAPITRVLSGIADIAGDSVVLRANGAQVAIDTADQGTGNFANAPMFIGRRGGTTLPFNGHIYSLIVRGAQSTAQQIASAEAWVNQRTGAY